MRIIGIKKNYIGIIVHSLRNTQYYVSALFETQHNIVFKNPNLYVKLISYNYI